MNKKYERYINYIVNDIKPPYFINMRDNYGLKDNEYELVLSKVFNQPLTIKGNNVFDQNNKKNMVITIINIIDAKETILVI